MRLPPLARKAAVVVAATVALVGAAPAEAAKPTYAERQLMRAVNDARRSHGLRPVRVGVNLQRGAHRFASHLRRTDRFYHSGVSAYENLAYGRLTRRMAWNVVSRWMNSPAHRANILRRGMRYGGFGVSRGEFLGYSRMQVSVARFRG
ncbi:MAG: CAP domain-containing protein [Actinobacteria bacterium]|nr:CAP domain-containing protein [Actinomycetota bacterium]